MKPMGLQTSLPDGNCILVADASAIINLNATGCAAEILEALPYRVVTPDVVVDELEAGKARGHQDVNRLATLVAAGLVDIVTLGDIESIHFEGLVVGVASETLDDGEAATIAYAVAANAVAVIDERKALRLCAARYPDLRLCCTVDLLAHPSVNAHLGESRLRDAVYYALIDARMRVLPQHVAGVVELIGGERIVDCLSLPHEVRVGFVCRKRQCGS
jgi:predicted nucleic acid-binding protein